MLYVGRLSQEKGVHYAIEVARYLGIKLILAATLHDADRSYFEECIKPRLNDKIEWIGEVNQDLRNKLMAGARCFIHAATYQEPFGLTLIEAMATGCPVVAFNAGSIPEIIEHGKTGYVVNNLDQMIEAVQQIDTIDRAYCRERVLTNFNAAQMADGYERLFRKSLAAKYLKVNVQPLRASIFLNNPGAQMMQKEDR
jgi:glycosyltransferase involved in cell wall biosynthesis